MKRILLVEPEAVLAEVTAFRLELLGYGVEHVTTAEEALEKTGQGELDLLITNLELPEMSGMALIERLSSDEETSWLPIIVLSLDADLDRVQAVHNAGACDFLVVPFEPEVLAAKVEQQMERSARQSSQRTEVASAV